MDLLVEKGGQRTYLSRYKVITTSFEESSPSVKRNNTQIQYRNGNVDFGGWNEAKAIDYVGYYRADDLEDEEYLRERIYALLSDPEGYYITQLKNDDDNSFERPGETSGDYFDKQVNRPSHKRFYVYASSLESELVGSYGGHVLYKISAKFTTMKLPYGESVPRVLDIKKNVPYYSENLVTGSSSKLTTITVSGWGSAPKNYASGTYGAGKYYASAYVENTTPVEINIYVNINGSKNFSGNKIQPGKSGIVNCMFDVLDGQSLASMWVSFTSKQTESYTYKYKELMITRAPSLWSPSQQDPGYNEWYLNTYYNTKNLVIPYAGTVPCSQLEQGFIVEFTAKASGSNLKISINGTDFVAPGNVVSGDVFKMSGYEYLRNGVSIVKATNKAYFKLLPGATNKISSSIAGSIRILNYQDLYA